MCYIQREIATGIKLVYSFNGWFKNFLWLYIVVVLVI